MKRITGRLTVSATLLGISGMANAAGFALIEQGGSGMGNAYAGAAAVAEDATTIFFNPAGMTYLPDSQLVFAAHAIKPSVDFDNEGSRTLQGTLLAQPITGGNGGDAGDWALVPNLYYTKAVNDSFRLGLGINAPFGLKTEYDSSWVGRYDAIKSELKTININPSLAFKVNDMVSLGAGISAQYIDVELTNALDFGSICTLARIGSCAGPQAHDGRLKLTGDDWSYGYNLGALFSPTQGTRIGLTYRSRVIHHLEGDAKFSGVPTALAAAPTVQNGNIKADVTLPEIASVSAFHQVTDQWDILGDVTWTRWSRFKELRVERTNGSLIGATPENWENTLRYSLGLNYRYSEALKLRAGVAFDESPVPSTYRTPRIPDNDRKWFSLGANYKLSQAGSIDFGYTHIFVKDASVNLTNPVSSTLPPTITRNLKGDYENDVNILSLQYTHNF
jgi:long-chain fatty acid transport protein